MQCTFGLFYSGAPPIAIQNSHLDCVTHTHSNGGEYGRLLLRIHQPHLTENRQSANHFSHRSANSHINKLVLVQMKMLRICQRLNAWRTVHRRPIPVTASYSPVLSSCPNAYTTSKQPESVLPNQWCSRSYSKNVQEQPKKESFDFMKAYQKPINDYYAENIYKGHLSIILGVIKIAAVYQSIWCTICYNQIIDYISKFDDPLTTVAMYSAAGTVVFVIPALLHAVNKNIAFDITHNPDTDEYTASTISWLVLKKFVS